MSQLCTRQGCTRQGTLLCSRCKIARYCCQPCQKDAWTSHKLTCKKPSIPTPVSTPVSTPTPCGNKKCTQPGTHLCSHCKKVKYCSQLCQKKAWKSHKSECIECITRDDFVKYDATGELNIIRNKSDAPITPSSRANDYIQQGNGHKALECLAEYKKVFHKLTKKDQVLIIVSKATALLIIEQPAKAEKQLRKALVLDPVNASALCTLASIYDKTDKPELAIQLLEKALSINPTRVDIIANYIRLLEKVGRVRESEAIKSLLYAI